MADPTIEADYGVLAAKASELERIKAGLDAWKHGTQVTAMFAAVGDWDLQDALGAFHDGWRDGVDEIEQNLDGAIALLKSAAEGYRTADENVAGAAGRMIGS